MQNSFDGLLKYFPLFHTLPIGRPAEAGRGGRCPRLGSCPKLGKQLRDARPTVLRCPGSRPLHIIAGYPLTPIFCIPLSSPCCLGKSVDRVVPALHAVRCKMWSRTTFGCTIQVDLAAQRQIPSITIGKALFHTLWHSSPETVDMQTLSAGPGRQLCSLPTRHVQVNLIALPILFSIQSSAMSSTVLSPGTLTQLDMARHTPLPAAWPLPPTSCNVDYSPQGATRALGTVSPDVERPKLIYISSTAPGHDRLGHPECAARGAAILDALQANKLTPEALPGQVWPAKFLLRLLNCRQCAMWFP